MENPIKSIAPLIFGRGGSRRPALRPGEIGEAVNNLIQNKIL